MYETLLKSDDELNYSDVEERAALAVDGIKLTEDLHGRESEESPIEDAESRVVSPFRSPRTRTPQRRPTHSSRAALHNDNSQMQSLEDDADGDVPQSLLLEDELRQLPPRPSEDLHTPRPLHNIHTLRQDPSSFRTLPRSRVTGMVSPKERALWRWANVENLDNFLMEVYEYFLGNGIYSIILSKVLNLLSVILIR